MARRKSISARSRMNQDPIELEIDDNVFQCQRNIPGIVLLDFMGNIDEDEPSTMAKALNELIFSCLEEHERERFKTYISDPENGVDIEALSEIAGWLAEQYTGRPTTQPG